MGLGRRGNLLRGFVDPGGRSAEPAGLPALSCGRMAAPMETAQVSGWCLRTLASSGRRCPKTLLLALSQPWCFRALGWGHFRLRVGIQVRGRVLFLLLRGCCVEGRGVGFIISLTPDTTPRAWDSLPEAVTLSNLPTALSFCFLGYKIGMLTVSHPGLRTLKRICE